MTLWRLVEMSGGYPAKLETALGSMIAELVGDELTVRTVGLDPVDEMVDRLREFLQVLLGPDRGCRGEIQTELKVSGVSLLQPARA